MSNNYQNGFADQRSEVDVADIPVKGTMPEWLSGILLRNGPARFHVGDKTLNHWFDGLAMLHKFEIKNGKVGYANKYLDTPALHAADDDGEMKYSEFATDPCRSLFKRVAHVFEGSKFGANANVSIGRLADEFVAQTEVPMPVTFNEKTLETIGVVKYEDQIKGDITTAHPHYDEAKGESYNYLLAFGPTSTYNIYKLKHDSKYRTVMGSATAEKPSYMHSFGMSEHYAILMEFPFVVNPMEMLVKGKPFIANYKWEPERGTRFSLVHRETGKLITAHTDEAWFGFHHVNAVERGDKLDVDIVVYPTAEVVHHFYLKSLLDRPNNNVFPNSELRRFTIDLKTGVVTARTLGTHSAELPRINYEYNTKPYRYVYACSIADEGESAFLDALVKFDIETGTAIEWKHDGQFPGEPVFVPRPGGKKEDDGVILSVVFDAATSTSFMLVLDAHDLSEIARAHAPQHVPFGFHGTFALAK